jgi:putative endopeptidase
VDWHAYFAAIGLDTLTAPGASLDISQPAFYRYFSHALTEVPLSDWRVYLRWQLLNGTAFLLSRRYIEEDFRFDQRLTGTKELEPRWKRCVNRTDRALGEALGQLYVAREFSPAAKARMTELVSNLEAVFRSRIEALDWMSAETKQRALIKLGAFTKKIGYPDRWRDYSRLTVAPDSPFVTNWMAARTFETRRQLAKVGKPKDKTEWTMSPPTVNAYYEPLNNEIVFPAGILKPPFFDPDAEDAVNYGGIGMVIGHEMTHGFDDQGRQYDPSGNLRDWWTTADAKGFTDRAQTVVVQYGAYAPMTGLHINGQQTLGENLADIGGLTLAYYAYERSLQGKPRRVIDGFTPEQRFFLGAAQAWHSAYRPEFLRMLVLTDVHSPDSWRVNGAVSAMPEFAAAFGCGLNAPMVRSDAARARIW